MSTDPISALKRYDAPVALVTPLSLSQTCWFVSEYFEEDTLTVSALVEFGFTHAVTGVLVYARFPIAAAMLPAATPSDGFAAGSDYDLDYRLPTIAYNRDILDGQWACERKSCSQ